MPQAAGVVQYINENDTKVGTTYNIRLEGDDKYYGLYKTKPKFDVGDYVEFNYSTKGDFHNVQHKSVEVTAQTNVQSSAGAGDSEPKGSAEQAFKKSDGREAQTRWHAARGSAIDFCQLAFEAGALDVGQGKKAEKFEALDILVSQKTLEYFNEATEVSSTGEVPEEYQG